MRLNLRQSYGSIGSGPQDSTATRDLGAVIVRVGSGLFLVQRSSRTEEI